MRPQFALAGGVAARIVVARIVGGNRCAAGPRVGRILEAHEGEPDLLSSASLPARQTAHCVPGRFQNRFSDG